MQYLALASDYDGTLATDGQVQGETLAALKRLQETGRKLILVTGRQFEDLCQVFPQVDWFDFEPHPRNRARGILARRLNQLLSNYFTSISQHGRLEWLSQLSLPSLRQVVDILHLHRCRWTQESRTATAHSSIRFGFDGTDG